MHASARSSIAKVTSPPSAAPGVVAAGVVAELGQTSSRSALARSRTSSRGAAALVNPTSRRTRPLAAALGRSPSFTSTVWVLAVADDLERHGVTRVVVRDQLREVGFADDLVPVDRDDHVATRRRLWPWKLICLVRRLEARVVGRAAVDHLGDQRAGVGRQAEPIGELGIERLGGDADVRVLDLAVWRSWSSEWATRPIGTAKPTPSLPPEFVLICWLIPITLAVSVEQGAAGVSGVDRGVGLDRPVDLEVGQRLDRAVGGRDDPDRQRLLLVERAPDRGNGLADCDVLVGRERERVQVEAVGVDLEQRHVGIRVEADDVRRDPVAVGELDVDLLGLVDGAASPRCRRR